MLFRGGCRVVGCEVGSRPPQNRPRNWTPLSRRFELGNHRHMSNLWSGRFDSEPNAAVFDFGASFRFDRRLFEDDVIGSLAWAEALKSAGALSAPMRRHRGGPA